MIKIILFCATLSFFSLALAQSGSEASGKTSKQEDPASTREVREQVELGAAHTSPRGDNLTESFKPCDDSQCEKHSDSASRLDDDNCMRGANVFSDDCRRGAGRQNSPSSGTGSGDEQQR